MGRLVVWRNQVLHRYVDLSRPIVKIGRAPQNDVVLEDPEKAVSRFHAEVRRDGNEFVLIDLNSQNGTWVDTARVDRLVLRPGVPVGIGPYLLVLESGPESR